MDDEHGQGSFSTGAQLDQLLGAKSYWDVSASAQVCDVPVPGPVRESLSQPNPPCVPVAAFGSVWCPGKLDETRAAGWATQSTTDFHIGLHHLPRRRWRSKRAPMHWVRWACMICWVWAFARGVWTCSRSICALFSLFLAQVLQYSLLLTLGHHPHHRPAKASLSLRHTFVGWGWLGGLDVAYLAPLSGPCFRGL